MINNLEKLAIQEAINEIDHINFYSIASKVEERLLQCRRSSEYPVLGEEEIKFVKDLIIEVTRKDLQHHQTARVWLGSIMENK